jgi:hypothetical protein
LSDITDRQGAWLAVLAVLALVFSLLATAFGEPRGWFGVGISVIMMAQLWAVRKGFHLKPSLTALARTYVPVGILVAVAGWAGYLGVVKWNDGEEGQALFRFGLVVACVAIIVVLIRLLVRRTGRF